MTTRNRAGRARFYTTAEQNRPSRPVAERLGLPLPARLSPFGDDSRTIVTGRSRLGSDRQPGSDPESRVTAVGAKL